VFDDEHLVSCAGYCRPEDQVRVGQPSPEAEHRDRRDVRRRRLHRRPRRGALRWDEDLFSGVYAPSTIGVLLREFTFGHARQLESVLREHLSALCERVELLPPQRSHSTDRG
jgi:hypothetical protein